MIDKINKLSLPATILISCVILGGFYYFSEQNKQESIERQQQLELQQTKEKADREFIANEKEACLAIYKQESSKWNNVNGWNYNEYDKTCYIEYKDSPKKTQAQCDESYKGEDGKVFPIFFTDYLLCTEGLFRKSF